MYLLATSMFLIVVCTSLLAFLEFEKSKYVKVEFDKTERNFVNFGKKVIQSELSGYVSDLLFFRDMVESNYFNTNLKNREYSREKLSEYFYFFIKRAQEYESISFLDLKGDEIVKVSYDGQKAYISHPSELKNYSGEEFFSDILTLKKKEIYMEKIKEKKKEEDNEEERLRDKHKKSCIRICIPIVNNNIRRGIMMFIYDADNLLELFEKSLVRYNQELYLVNHDSDFMSSLQKVDEMATKHDIGFANKMNLIYPQEWKFIQKENDGQISTKNGYFTFTNLKVKDIHFHNKESEYKIIFADQMWHIISHVERADFLKIALNEDKLMALLGIFQDNVILYFFLVLISFFISFALVFNKYNKERIQYFSEYDDMTKALNRRAGREKLEKLISENELVSICFTDVNGLKIVNDTLGHEHGDELLKTFSGIVLKSTRRFDYLVRLGGDEFLIIFPDLVEEKAYNVWSRIQREIDYINENEDRAYEVSVSYGIVDTNTVKSLMEASNAKNPAFVAEQMVKIADEKMYENKSIVKKNLKILR